MYYHYPKYSHIETKVEIYAKSDNSTPILGNQTCAFPKKDDDAGSQSVRRAIRAKLPRFQGRWKEGEIEGWNCKIAEGGIGRSCSVGELFKVDHQSNKNC